MNTDHITMSVRQEGRKLWAWRVEDTRLLHLTVETGYERSESNAIVSGRYAAIDYVNKHGVDGEWRDVWRCRVTGKG